MSQAIFQSTIGGGYSRQITFVGSPGEGARKIRDYAATEPAGALIAVHSATTNFIVNRDEHGWHFKSRSPVGRAFADLL
jgi:hypothetical protein